jgi:hypothetical protein
MNKNPMMKNQIRRFPFTPYLPIPDEIHARNALVFLKTWPQAIPAPITRWRNFPPEPIKIGIFLIQSGRLFGSLPARRRECLSALLAAQLHVIDQHDISRVMNEPAMGTCPGWFRQTGS